MPGTTRVVLTGSTGFVGGAVLAALTDAHVPVTRLVRTQPQVPGRERRVIGDLADPASLDRACQGATSLVHAASYVGADARLHQQVNVDGTRALLDAAGGAGITRIVYLSTAGVYGGTLAPGASEAEAVPAPRSPLSRSRREAEGHVLAAGGVVVRPNLVHGVGDRWFLSPLLTLMHRVDAWIGDGAARLSVIDRIQLGAAIAALATGAPEAGVYHAAAPEPVVLSTLVEAVHARAGVPAPTRRLEPDDALRRLAPYGVTPSQVAMVTTDNWFDTSKLWATTTITPAPGT